MSAKKKNKKKNIFWRLIKVLFLLIIVLGVLGAGATYIYVKGIVEELPTINPSKIDDLLGENSVILDSEGRVLEHIQNDGLRTIIRYGEMSPELINAFIAVEDKTFREHHGFNFVRIAGAVVEKLSGKGRISGTSTITQQLARNLYLEEIRSQRSLERKIKEAFYAIQLEDHLTKEQIIEAYLNKIYLGSNSNGVAAAADSYFSKEAKDLDLVESAMLAGIPKSPLKYSPIWSKKKIDVTEDDYIIDDSDPIYTLVFNSDCVARYKLSLLLMHENGYITDEQYEEAKNVDIKTRLNPHKTANNEISSYFADMVKDDVVNDLIEKYDYTTDEAYNLLYTNGLKIYSTIDFDLQKTLESAYSTKNRTPYFGNSTLAAVKGFQKKYNLAVDGSVGNGTLNKLAELGVINRADFTKNFYKKGMEAPEIVQLKEALNKLGLLVNNDNIPLLTVYFNSRNDIVSKDRQKILLYDYDNLVTINGDLLIPSSDYRYDSEGNIILLKNKRLHFYPHYQNKQLVSIQAVVKNSYKYDKEESHPRRNSDGSYDLVNLYIHRGGEVSIPNEYKTFDESNNLVVDKDFIMQNPEFFTKDGAGNLLINKNGFIINQKGTVQPQSSMVIIDYRTGELKAIVGGRNIEGQKIYNRAMNPRQPGSAIKPIGVYAAAIESREFNAATVIDDVPTYMGSNPNKRWPFNWYEHSRVQPKYWGRQTLRNGIEYSINVLAVKLADKIGVARCYDFLKRYEFSTLVDSGRYNDQNLSSVSLGGMTKGLTPFELTTAYGAIANGGVMNKTITYSKVLDKNGVELLVNTPEKIKITDPQTAYIVQDMMRTAVTNGLCKAAAIRTNNSGIPVAGKTGTTSNKLDVWFVGYTPYYVAGVWFGNDVNMPLDQGSIVASKFWNKVMSNVHAEFENKAFERPEGIISLNVDTQSGMLPSELSYLDPRNTVRLEIFIKGTEPTEFDNVHIKANICTESGKLMNPNYCPDTLIEERVLVTRVDPEYSREQHLDWNGEPIKIRDDDYVLYDGVCDIHTPNSDMGDMSDYGFGAMGKKVIYLENGEKLVVNAFYVKLVNSSNILIPVESRILEDGTIILPDDSMIYPETIVEMPEFSKKIESPEENGEEDIENVDVNTINENSGETIIID